MSQVKTGQQAGLWVCQSCYQTLQVANTARAYCPRCHAAVHARRPNSLRTTSLLLIAAVAAYVPANLLPVMHTTTLFGEEDDTIMSGVLALLHSGSWPLALIVFIASIVVPLLKLISMALLIDSVHRPSRWQSRQRSDLYRLVEFIGRWSMLDVYVIALLVALVQIQSLANIKVGFGALAFCSVVVLTLLAAQSFDERLLWDRSGHE